MIHTAIQILVFQLLFLAIYGLFLKKETFFNWNRVFLLLTPMVTIILPFISLEIIQRNIPAEYMVQLPEVIIGEINSDPANNSVFWLTNLLNVWIAGIFISALIFSYKMFKLLRLKRLGTARVVQNTSLIILPNTDSAFSFFNTIYLGENISEDNKDSIIAHEKIHIQHKHSWDLLYFELLRIVFWFNPMVYVFQNRISTLHEYIADAEVTRHIGKKQYYQNLLSEVFQTQEISFVNTFFKESLIKKRIIMLQKSKSPKIKLMKFLMMVPILGAMLFYTSCSDSTDKIQETEEVNLMPPPPPANRENVIVQIDTIWGGNEISDVPYSVIEQVPTYPGCSGDNETMKNCMSAKIAEFVNDNFNTAIADNLNISGRQRIAVQFKIDKTGKVVDVRARAKNPEFEAEAIRVVEMLPQMLPGKQKGEKVGVLYSLPIVFDVK